MNTMEGPHSYRRVHNNVGCSSGIYRMALLGVRFSMIASTTPTPPPAAGGMMSDPNKYPTGPRSCLVQPWAIK